MVVEELFQGPGGARNGIGDVMMRVFLRLCSIGLVLGAGLASMAWSQDYPARVIKIISPHPPGIATDVLGRALAQKLNDKFGQPVIVENRTATRCTSPPAPTSPMPMWVRSCPTMCSPTSPR
jgi:hypothetical protein